MAAQRLESRASVRFWEGLRPIHYLKDRLAGFPAVVCDPKLPSAKGRSRPIAVFRSDNGASCSTPIRPHALHLKGIPNTLATTG